MFKTIFILALITTTQVFALNSYYPAETENIVENSDSETVRDHLFQVLNTQHQRVQGGHDKLGCSSRSKGECYRQIDLGYKGARKVLFGKLHLEKDGQGYYIKDVYCRKEFRRSHTRMGPGQIPNSNVLNCEHTWPQSKFSGQFSKSLQKSDLHHLYPTDSHANSVRSNFEFGNVDGRTVDSDCTASHTEGPGRFEPPSEHKGNVARAVFYFATRYNMKINRQQEETLRQWHLLDPVDAEEMERNEIVYSVQKNRNPFVDMPELVGKITDF
jgi:deoxyribonuclease-1